MCVVASFNTNARVEFKGSSERKADREPCASLEVLRSSRHLRSTAVDMLRGARLEADSESECAGLLVHAFPLFRRSSQRQIATPTRPTL